jgi:hypothetical protein
MGKVLIHLCGLIVLTVLNVSLGLYLKPQGFAFIAWLIYCFGSGWVVGTITCEIVDKVYDQEA